ncbi:MAG: hypothetical protein LBC41_17530 [Clostridiales bacterium]|jgi:DNA repair exonuclease SbcCD ATPase subunit|nr:hypothetical protein [Clostridiales bacterium]
MFEGLQNKISLLNAGTGLSVDDVVGMIAILLKNAADAHVYLNEGEIKNLESFADNFYVVGDAINSLVDTHGDSFKKMDEDVKAQAANAAVQLPLKLAEIEELRKSLAERKEWNEKLQIENVECSKLSQEAKELQESIDSILSSARVPLSQLQEKKDRLIEKKKQLESDLGELASIEAEEKLLRNLEFLATDKAKRELEKAQGIIPEERIEELKAAVQYLKSGEAFRSQEALLDEVKHLVAVWKSLENDPTFADAAGDGSYETLLDKRKGMETASKSIKTLMEDFRKKYGELLAEWRKKIGGKGGSK